MAFSHGVLAAAVVQAGSGWFKYKFLAVVVGKVASVAAELHKYVADVPATRLAFSS